MKNCLCCTFLILGSLGRVLSSINVNEKVLGLKDFSKDYVVNGDKIDDLLNHVHFSYYDKNRVFEKKLSYKFEFDDGNPDVHGNIVRPCQVYDTFCIRKLQFFAEHSKCKISGRKLPSLFYRAQGTAEYPSANMSTIAIAASYEGIDNGRVEEFYINTATDNLVIAFYFDDVKQISNVSQLLKFYLRGREPEVLQGFGGLSYLQITVTMVIPGLHDLRLDRAEITTYANNPILPFVISPTLAASTNPEVLAMATYFLTAGIPYEHLEELSTEGIFISGNYLQYNICDFGLKII